MGTTAAAEPELHGSVGRVRTTATYYLSVYMYTIMWRWSLTCLALFIMPSRFQATPSGCVLKDVSKARTTRPGHSSRRSSGA